jgi:hypothetical protein
LANVTFAEFVVLPIVSPLILEARVIFVIGQESAEAKLSPKERTVNAPLQSTDTAAGTTITFPSKITLLVDAKTLVKAFFPITVAPVKFEHPYYFLRIR